MTKRKGIPDDGIQRLIEWEEHQYNSGYWVNRISPFFPPKRTKGNWILSLIDLVIYISTFLALLIYYIENLDPWIIIPLILIGLLTIVIFLRTRNLKPINNQVDENEPGQDNDHRNKKKLPKRRKDYR